jgi:hypothetical protein
MTWVRIDDGFFRHPKALGAGKDGRALFVAALCWSSANLTDGRIPREALRVVCGDAEVKLSTAAVLVAAGLWHEHPDGGWVVHDWSVYQRSAGDVGEWRERGRERARRSYEKRKPFAHSSREDTSGLREVFGPSSPSQAQAQAQAQLLEVVTSSSISNCKPDTPAAAAEPDTIPELVQAAIHVLTADAEARARQSGRATPVRLDRWRTAVHQRILREHLDQLAALHATEPGLDPAELASRVTGQSPYELGGYL